MAASKAAAAEEDASLGSAIFARLHPASYLSRFLSSSIRPDGRALDAFRSSNMATSTIETSEGSCIVRQGSTIIVAGVKAEILDLSEEDDDSDEEESKEKTVNGYGLGPVDRKRIIVGVELSPMASAKFRPGPPGEESQVLASRLMAILESCPPLNSSSLVIEKGVSSWCLYVDLVCLSYDGNVLDAALLAIYGALKDTRLPQATFDETTQQVICSPDTSLRKPLALTSSPLSCSFGIIDGKYILSDMDAFESSLASSTITVTLDTSQQAEDEIVSIHCTGACSAFISLQEAAQASVTGLKEENGRVQVKDEGLISVCIFRARRRCAELSLLNNNK